MNNYKLKTSLEVLQTSRQGDRIAPKENVIFNKNALAEGGFIKVSPDIFKQVLSGIGTSFTESSAFVLAHLKPEQRAEVMHKIFSEEGANFSLTRTHIGSCDFCVEGHYAYAEKAGDINLQHFSIQSDQHGFKTSQHPGIKDESFDLLPMIKQVQAIKAAQRDSELNIIASAWTAPPWMKDIETWHIPGAPGNDFQGTGGILKPEYESVYADYLIKYLDAYREEGVDIWGITPVNEPLGNNGQWESMHFSAESQGAFIKQYLGPKLRQSDHKNVQLLMYDHNRDELEEWADVIYGDAETSQYVDGAAIHWYESTEKVAEDVLEKVHAKYPGYSIIHTEGCIDDLGKDAPDGILDPEGFKESDWFDNDVFWWNKNATDWAYTATWPGVNSDDHPMYTPVHRYARNIIVSLNHWVSGWIDWNIVLDQYGGPNHVGNFCGAPIMINTTSGYVYYTPIFYILAQLSRTIRPGDRMVQTDAFLPEALKDSLYACASLNAENILSVQVLNVEKYELFFSLQIGIQHAPITIPANCLQTIRVQL